MSKRYYHYIGPACNELFEFDSLYEAMRSAGGSLVFDARTKLPAVIEPLDLPEFDNVIYRLADNYEDKGDFMRDFHELLDLFTKAALLSPEIAARIYQLALDNGVIELD